MSFGLCPSSVCVRLVFFRTPDDGRSVIHLFQNPLKLYFFFHGRQPCVQPPAWRTSLYLRSPVTGWPVIPPDNQMFKHFCWQHILIFYVFIFHYLTIWYILLHLHPLLGYGLVHKFPRRQILGKQSVARLRNNRWGCFLCCLRQATVE
jgi:hypothetical protein